MTFANHILPKKRYVKNTKDIYGKKKVAKVKMKASALLAK